MHSRLAVLALSLCAVVSALSACSAPPGDDDGGTDAGSLPTDAGARDAGVDGGTAPLKLLFVFDGAQSFAVTDPNGERAAAMLALLDSLPATPEVSFATMVFQGSTTAWLNSQIMEFTPLASFGSAQRQQLATRLLTFTSPGDAGVDSRDFVRGVDSAWTMIYLDAMSAVTNGTPPKAKYVVIFVSDGRPSINQDDQLLCGDVVRRIRNLRLYADDVFVSTVHVFKPAQAVGCGGDAGLLVGGSSCAVPETANPGVCASTEVELDALRLRRMADLGAGEFRDFRAGQAVTFEGLIP